MTRVGAIELLNVGGWVVQARGGLKEVSALETWATERLWDASWRIQARCLCVVGGKAHRGGYSDGPGIAISFQLCSI